MGAKRRRGVCLTPDAEYGTIIAPSSITLTVDLPFMVPEEVHQTLKAKCHAALLGPIEWLFRQQWHQMAGREDEAGGTFPAKWEDL